MNNLIKYGAGERFFAEASLYPDLCLARVISQYKDLYKIAAGQDGILAEVSGKFRYEAACLSDYPAVGDFVMVDRSDAGSGNAIIHRVLTRKSVFERAAVGTDHETQVVAANIDIVFICMSLNNDYNLSRLERYLSVAWNSRATPVVVLTKSDLCDNLPAVLEEISGVALDADVVVTSSFDQASCNKLLPYLQQGVTASFIGSSGVGKSTLINRLAGEELLATSAIRQDDKGRHTTTRRELLILPQGGVVIDTPGMRELGVESVDLSRSFADMDTLVSRCRFHDCTHTTEPGCAVQQALQTGALDKRRFENYQKLRREARYDGLSSRQIEAEKIQTIFGGLGGMKQARDFAKRKNKRR
ncbi:MAG: ribosome small subunit-dependent GTPase A [Intestinibacillus sp.]